ncbi:DNA topoisomerase IB [Niabella insulamsoli]|uniref:DNA topoisomerase IB n=1 Tax=Niabella insulamsoli TaxID=3144874 RepID=UPI0031FC1925
MQIEAANTRISITPQKLVDAIDDPEKSARIVKLVYVSDAEKGIQRIKSGKSFNYKKDGKKVKDEKTLARIKSLVIPPAWKDVWICAMENGHLQCTGLDAAGRKQYRYHPLWNALRKETKFYRLLQFGQTLTAIRKKLSAHLAEPALTKQKVLAAVVSTMDKTGIRVGNNMYEKLYGSYGLSTLKDQHIKINGQKVAFSFKGKKGVHQKISMKSARLARIIKQCKEIPGKELFQYIDDEGTRHAISSGDVNDYIKDISGGAFTSKDFRTWSGTVDCMLQFAKIGGYETKTEMKKNMVTALNCVAQTLGNTPAVCKSHYVHPLILEMYEDARLQPYLKTKSLSKGDRVAKVEPVLLKILKKEKSLKK